MPEPVVRAFAENRAVVEAERQLQMITATQLGMGSVPKEDADQQLRELRRIAGAERPARKPKSLSELAAFGIKVTRPDGKEVRDG